MSATGTTPARSRRHNPVKENIYFEPGKQGRKTGITLKDTGIRDEHGLEPVSGIFSSPVASPQPNGNGDGDGDDAKKHNGKDYNGSISTPDSNTTRKLRRTPRSHLPPPKSATPRHTNIGGSPIRPTPTRPDSRHGSPTRPLSAQPDRANRLLDFTATNTEQSVAGASSPFKSTRARPATTAQGASAASPGAGAERSNAPAKSTKLQKTRKSIFHIAEFDSPAKRPQPNAARSESAELEQSVAEVQDVLASIGASADQGTNMDTSMANGDGDGNDDDNSHSALRDNSIVAQPTPVQRTPQASGLGSGRSTRSNGIASATRVSLGTSTDDSPSIVNTQKRKRHGRHPSPVVAGPVAVAEMTQKRTRLSASPNTTTSHTVLEPETAAENEGQTQVDLSIIDTATYAPDAPYTDYTIADENTAIDTTEQDLEPTTTMIPEPEPTHVARLQSYEPQAHAADGPENDVSSADEYSPPPEDDNVRDMDIDPQLQAPSRPKKGKRQTKSSATTKPRARKPAAREPKASSGRPLSPGRDSGSDSQGTTRRRGTKSIVSLRAGTPAEDEGATTTRSGRVSIKPLQYWCNETYVWRHGEVDGIVRAESVEQPSRKPVNRNKRSKPKPAQMGSIAEEDDEDEDLLPEAWEDELGVIHGPVRSWDPELGAGDPVNQVNEDVAFASTALVTHDVRGGGFRYAKVMTSNFFGAGMVEIPPEGAKQTKNSRKMQMIFFVHTGKVTVEVGEIKFGMTRGGVWQVPRGNHYAIFNESKRHTAKIFFAQACEPELADDAVTAAAGQA